MHEKEIISNYFNSISTDYDKNNKKLYWKLSDDLLWEIIKKNIPTDKSIIILELGAGTGEWAYRILNEFRNVNLLKEKLEQGNLIILAGELTGGYHAVLLTGYNENNFIVCDPLYKNKQTRTFEEIEKYMDTSIGKWFIAVNEKIDKLK